MKVYSYLRMTGQERTNPDLVTKRDAYLQNRGLKLAKHPQTPTYYPPPGGMLIVETLGGPIEFQDIPRVVQKLTDFVFDLQTTVVTLHDEHEYSAKTLCVNDVVRWLMAFNEENHHD